MKRVITISREFGSGGHSIGKALAERLGFAYYDKELVKQVSAETGFDPAYIEEHGEFASSQNMLGHLFNSIGMNVAMKGLSASDFLWCIQREVILKLADQEPCVIVGRCADFILNDREDCLHAFIHAPIAYRAERIVRLYGETDKTPEQRLRDKDKRRRINYKHYTDREWGLAENYHVCLDSAAIGIDHCVDLLANLASQ